MSMPLTGAPAGATPEGITNPPIDDLLDQVTSASTRWSIYAAKRARQINDYYSQLGEGLLEYVGPLVEPGPREKPLSIAHARDPGGPARAHRGRRVAAGPVGRRDRTCRRPASCSVSQAGSPPTRRASCSGG